MEETIKKPSLFSRFIAGVERVGNKFPHPFYLFCALILVAFVLSVIFAGTSAVYEKASAAGDIEQVTVTIINLFNKDILRNLFQNLDTIYFSFAPMKMMVLLILAIGLAERVGLFQAFIKRTILGAPAALVFAIVSFVAINANTASNAGILGTTAVAAAVFHSLGYNPWLGIILAYAAGNAGMSANIFVGNLDVLMAGINESVVAQLGIQANVHVLEHWYFMAASAVVLTIAFTILTTKFMRGYIGEPNLQKIAADNSKATGSGSGGSDTKESKLSAEERKALGKAGIAALIFFVVLVGVILMPGSFLRADDGSLLPTSPLTKSILALLFLFFMATAIVYGRSIGKIAVWNDLPKLLAKSLDSVAGFIVIALPASVFIHLFNASNIPTVLGIKGAELIQAANLNGFAVLASIAIITTFLNLFMTSGSSKWMILAPIFIPMFYAIGFTPGLTSVAYRIGDSATNAIAPISTDIALIIGLLETYKPDPSKKVGMGTVIALCLPYGIVTFIIEILMLLGWYLLDLPLGPGVGLFV